MNDPISPDLLIEQVQLLRLEPGDILAIKCDSIHPSRFESLIDRLAEWKVKAMIVPADTELTVIRRER